MVACEPQLTLISDAKHCRKFCYLPVRALHFCLSNSSVVQYFTHIYIYIYILSNTFLEWWVKFKTAVGVSEVNRVADKSNTLEVYNGLFNKSKCPQATAFIFDWKLHHSWRFLPEYQLLFAIWRYVHVCSWSTRVHKSHWSQTWCWIAEQREIFYKHML